MRDYIKEACEQIDAAMFSGDDFDNPATRAEFREYMNRWTRQIDCQDVADEDLKTEES